METITPIVGFTIGMLIGHYFRKHKINKELEEEKIAHIVNEHLLYYMIMQLYGAYGAEITVNLINNSIKMMVNNQEITVNTDTEIIAQEILNSIFSEFEDGEDYDQSN